MKPLNPDREKAEESFARVFCATLPSERKVLEVSKAFCATLPGEPDAKAVTKSFCATLPSERKIRSETGEILREILKE
ncbi:MAG: hypothetical protein PVF58_21155 [Candidatus Methanofastidiosia archaeon]|jgi:hypothetical protein